MRIPAGLLGISPGLARDKRGARKLLGQVETAFKAGLPGVSIREPGLSDADLFELTGTCLELAAANGGAWVGVHDSLHVALAAGAHGVHLGWRSLSLEAARQAAGEGLALGYSAHVCDGADPAALDLADYLCFGPVLDTPSKAGLLEPTGWQVLREFCASSPRPVWALGGLGPAEVRAALDAGAQGVAAIGGLFGAEDIASATAAYLAAWDGSGAGT
jgi:thiamine-phosphate pyrophosphorylase